MSITKIVFFLFCISSYSCILARADEDDSFSALLEDVALGFTFAACEADEVCSKTMDTLFIPILLIALITFLVCPPTEDRNYQPMKPRRVVRTGLAYGVGRSLFS